LVPFFLPRAKAEVSKIAAVVNVAGRNLFSGKSSDTNAGGLTIGRSGN
jgi:hypothetical protein